MDEEDFHAQEEEKSSAIYEMIKKLAIEKYLDNISLEDMSMATLIAWELSGAGKFV